MQQEVNKNGAPLLGDSRDLFRPKTSDIPALPGVYKWRDEQGRVIYVGKAKNLRNRLTNYFQPLHQLHPRTQNMVLTARSLEWTVVGTELEALTLEYTWIKEFDPRFNVVFKDDKTYPYLAVSLSERIPRVWITRSRKRKGVRYFGPYAKVWPARQTLDALLKSFPVRTCTPAVFHKAQLTHRPCLLASIGKCSAPCVGNISASEHRELVEHIVGVFTGRLGKQYADELTAQMKQASADLEFEKAAKLRDRLAMLNTILEHNAVVLDEDVDADIFGFAADELEASIHAFFVRSGAIRGERNWSVERVEDITDEQLLADFLEQIYADLTKDSVTKDTASKDSIEQHALPQSSGWRSTGIGGTEPVADQDTESEMAHNHAALRVEQRREALAPTQSATALDAQDRAQATRARNRREATTGRDDLLAPFSPIPRQIIAPMMPDRSKDIEAWLTQLRGSKVSIQSAVREQKRELLERANANALQALQRSKLSRIKDVGTRTQAMNEIAQALGLDRAPLRIECYDISNTVGGQYQVASMVVFEDGIAKKSEYRRFAIRGTDGNGCVDDLSALYETLTRRFKHGNIAGDSGESMDNERRAQEAGVDAESSVQQNTNPRHFAYRPNLIVVDGGQPQVLAAARALHDCGVDDVALCGLAKRLEEIWLPDDDYPVIMKRQSEGMYLMQRVRDESHRFAITYHRKKRTQAGLRSALDSIEGIGPAQQKLLLKHFGSVRAMRAASVEEFMQVEGVGKVKAERLYQALHEEQASQEHSATHEESATQE